MQTGLTSCHLSLKKTSSELVVCGRLGWWENLKSWESVLEKDYKGISAPSATASSVFHTIQATSWRQQDWCVEIVVGIMFALLCTPTNESHL